jgi:hypothetical protein
MNKHVRLSYVHDFTDVKPAVHVEVVADNHEQALESLISLARGFGDDPPWRAKVSLSKLAKAVTKADVKKDPSLENNYARDEALKLLTKTYSSPIFREQTRQLLDKYEVKKFGDIPLDKSQSLLVDAQEIYKEMANGAQ